MARFDKQDQFRLFLLDFMNFRTMPPWLFIFSLKTFWFCPITKFIWRKELDLNKDYLDMNGSFATCFSELISDSVSSSINENTNRYLIE